MRTRVQGGRLGWLTLFIGVVLLIFVPATGIWAEDEEEEEEELPSELTEPSAADAKKLCDGLVKVARKKKGREIMPALEAIAEFSHPSFEKYLLKFVKHKSSMVSHYAARLWEYRVHDKIIKKLWKASWGDKQNKRRFVVKSKVLRGLARVGHILDKKQYSEVEKDWRWMIGQPDESFAPALVDICFYFETTKDKRHCRWMAEELDQPVAKNPNSPTNPPQAWWEKRWKMWQPMKPAAVNALRAITGEEFESVDQAKSWFKANEKKIGFKW